jgi:GMP synthase (glutamine-hydrolysing)
MMQKNKQILVLDFGSQYTQLIARKIRELHVDSVILSCDADLEQILSYNPRGIIFSGGPNSVYEENAPRLNFNLDDLDLPKLGICYGMQLVGLHSGAKVTAGMKHEYGLAKLQLCVDDPLLKGLTDESTVWMSHGDSLQTSTSGLEVIAKTENTPIAAIRIKKNNFWGVQFHPEVQHTMQGRELLQNFVFDICQCDPSWTAGRFIENQIREIRKAVGEKGQVICGISGGVDSTVAAVLIHRAIGDRITGIFVNNGLLRLGEFPAVQHMIKDNLGIPLVSVDATKDFLDRLNGVVDPEKKRKIIGHTFIDVFEKEAAKLDDVRFLAQGTLYPDVIESVIHRGPSQTIKTHHNVGGLPDRLNFKLVEPLRDLFKDEVRAVGEELGLPHSMLWRHPFPGPGLGIRILGEITEERIHVLQRADRILIEELKSSGWYDRSWQALAVLLPVNSVGVMGDCRTYESVLALRVVDSTDAMTADFSRLPWDLLGKISNRIINEVSGINRVVYDISSKPPATIEWE